jgi:hypothetical protein
MTTAGIQLQFTPLLSLYVLSAAITLGLTVYGARKVLGATGSRDFVSRHLLAGIARSQVRWMLSNAHHGDL